MVVALPVDDVDNDVAEYNFREEFDGSNDYTDLCVFCPMFTVK